MSKTTPLTWRFLLLWRLAPRYNLLSQNQAGLLLKAKSATRNIWQKHNDDLPGPRNATLSSTFLAELITVESTVRPRKWLSVNSSVDMITALKIATGTLTTLTGLIHAPAATCLTPPPLWRYVKCVSPLLMEVL